jgi:hypothetical protein
VHRELPQADSTGGDHAGSGVPEHGTRRVRRYGRLCGLVPTFAGCECLQLHLFTRFLRKRFFTGFLQLHLLSGFVHWHLFTRFLWWRFFSEFLQLQLFNGFLRMPLSS